MEIYNICLHLQKIKLTIPNIDVILTLFKLHIFYYLC